LGDTDALVRQSKACGTLINALHFLSRLLRTEGRVVAASNVHGTFDVNFLAEAVGLSLSFLLKNAMAISEDINTVPVATFPGEAVRVPPITILRRRLELLGSLTASTGAQILLLPNQNGRALARYILDSAVCQVTHVAGLYSYLNAGEQTGPVDGQTFVTLLARSSPKEPEALHELARALDPWDPFESLAEFRKVLLDDDAEALEAVLSKLRAGINSTFDDHGPVPVASTFCESAKTFASALHRLAETGDDRWVYSRTMLLEILSALLACDATRDEDIPVPEESDFAAWLARHFCAALGSFTRPDVTVDTSPFLVALVSPPIFPRIFGAATGSTRAAVLSAVMAVSSSHFTEAGKVAAQALSTVVAASLL
jgi:hypothetical protein